MVSIISNNFNAIPTALSNFGPTIFSLGSLLTFISLPFTASARPTDLSEKDITHFCGMLGKRTGVDGLREYLSFFNSHKEDRISCSYVAPDHVKTRPIKNYQALVQTKKGNYVKDHERFTVGDLSKLGVYTFDFPEELPVERTIFCGGEGEKVYSCNKFVRNSQEKPEGMTISEWKGWSLDQVYEYMGEIAQAEEFGPTTGLRISGNPEGLRMLNQTHPIPTYVQVEEDLEETPLTAEVSTEKNENRTI